MCGECVHYSIALVFFSETKAILIEDLFASVQLKLVKTKADSGWEWEGTPILNGNNFQTPACRQLQVVEFMGDGDASSSKYIK